MEKREVSILLKEYVYHAYIMGHKQAGWNYASGILKYILWNKNFEFWLKFHKFVPE